MFGTDEPDMQPPTAEIVEPADGMQVEAPADVQLRAIVADDYGGFGWKFEVEKDGELVVDQVDYDREVDAEFRAALNLTGLPAGSYILRVIVLDHFGGEGVSEVTLQVGPGASSGDDGNVDDTGDGTGDDGDDDGTGGDDADDDGDDEGGSGDVDGGVVDGGGPKRGCSVSGDATSRWSGALFLFAVLGLRRRRAA